MEKPPNMVTFTFFIQAESLMTGTCFHPYYFGQKRDGQNQGYSYYSTGLKRLEESFFHFIRNFF